MTAAPHSPMEMRVSDDRPNMFDPYVAALRIDAADAAFLGSRRQRRAPTTWPATVGIINSSSELCHRELMLPPCSLCIGPSPGPGVKYGAQGRTGISAFGLTLPVMPGLDPGHRPPQYRFGHSATLGRGSPGKGHAGLPSGATRVFLHIKKILATPMSVRT